MHALDCLARREHGVVELRTKLLEAGHPAEAVEATVAQLAEEHLLSDERFVASQIRWGVHLGHGPLKIEAKLLAKGVPSGVSRAHPLWAEVGWEALAQKLHNKHKIHCDQRAKQVRFLQQKGFSWDIIVRVIAHASTSD